MISEKYKNKKQKREKRKRQYNYLILSELKECSEILTVINKEMTRKNKEVF